MFRSNKIVFKIVLNDASGIPNYTEIQWPLRWERRNS